MKNILRFYNKIDNISTTFSFKRLPKHTAIIMDGNGRWAQAKGLMRTVGHKAGVDTLKQILEVAIDLKLEVLTVYAFSTENWKRPHYEVDFLMSLFSDYLAKEIDTMNKNNVNLRFLGKIDELTPNLKEQVRAAEEKTKNNTGLKFNVAMNYGGKDELIRAIKKLSQSLLNNDLSLENINESLLESYLDTNGLPPVDFVIRTSGDMRLSNFLLWQTAYAEFYFSNINWPDFTPKDFLIALENFDNRSRRFGGL